MEWTPLPEDGVRHIAAVRFRLVPDSSNRGYQAVCTCGWDGEIREQNAEAADDCTAHELGAVEGRA